jgi:hypothetical protein
MDVSADGGQAPLPTPGAGARPSPVTSEFSAARRLHRLSPKVLVLAAAGVVLVVAGAVYGLGSDNGPTVKGLGRSTGSRTIVPPVASSTTTTTLTPALAATEAREIELQGSDLGTGWTEVPGTGSSQSSPSATGPCAPVSSAPWLADVTSPQYQSPASWSAFSQVVVMPTAADASAALEAIDAPNYDTNCLQPTWDQWVREGLASTNGTTNCDLTFGGSTIETSLPSGTTQDVPNAVGYEYQAQVDCPTEGPSTVDRLSVSAVSGNVFVQEQFFGGEPPPWDTLLTTIYSMFNRATQVVAGRPVPG